MHKIGVEHPLQKNWHVIIIIHNNNNNNNTINAMSEGTSFGGSDSRCQGRNSSCMLVREDGHAILRKSNPCYLGFKYLSQWDIITGHFSL